MSRTLHDAVPPHDDARRRHEKWHKADERLDRLEDVIARPAAAAREPASKPSAARISDSEEDVVDEAIGIGIVERFDIVGRCAERLRNREIEARDFPHQNEVDEPYAERAMKIPIDLLPRSPEFHERAATPAMNARPPDH